MMFGFVEYLMMHSVSQVMVIFELPMCRFSFAANFPPPMGLLVSESPIFQANFIFQIVEFANTTFKATYFQCDEAFTCSCLYVKFLSTSFQLHSVCCREDFPNKLF